MKFHELSLEHFGPFRTRQVLPLADLGLVLVRGRNRVSAAADDNGCLAGDTLIDCPRDLTKYPRGIPLRDLVGQRPWLYAWDEQQKRIVLKRASRVMRTKRRAKVVRVKLTAYSGDRRNEWRSDPTRMAYNKGRFLPPTELVGTPDHLVLLTNGYWKRLGDLQPGDRLCSLYRRASTSPNNPSKRESILLWTGGRQTREARFIASEVWGLRSSRVHAHHKNHQSLDQRVENLEWKEGYTHLSEHTSERNRLGLAGWKVTGNHPRGMLGKHHTEAWKAQQSIRSKLQHQRVNHTVVSVEHAENCDVYDITVPDVHSFVANGVVVHNSGKTSLFSALSWALYGETLPGPDGKVQRADDVACRFTKEACVVRLALEDTTGKPWQIERTRRPGAVAFDGDGHYWTGEEANEQIVARVGFGVLTFRNAVVLGQGAIDRLATADQSAYLKMLDEIQGLSFKDALERAKLWRTTWAEKQAHAHTLAAQAAIKLQQSETSIALLEESYGRFSAEKAQRIADAVQAEADAQAAVSAAVIARDTAKAAKGRAAKLRERWDRLQELQQETHTKRETLEALRREHGLAQGKLETLEADLAGLVTAHRCPTCRRAVTSKAEVAEVRQLFATELRDAKTAAATAAAAREAAEKAWQANALVVTRHLAQCPKEFTERMVIEAEAAGGPDELRRREVDIATAHRREAETQRQLAAEKARKWDSAAVLAAARQAKAAAETEQTEANAQAERFGRTVAAAEYWIEAFGDRGLRSLLFDSVADFLNDRLAHHLRILAAGEADVTVSALTALKKGSMKERMSVSAVWGWGAGNYGAGSAGQGGRVNLALVAAHQDLAEHRSAQPFPLRIFDEPECHVDPRGQEILAQWIRTEASQRGTTFLVTHNPVLADLVEPDHHLTVVLESDGARLEWE